jgi:hypothetical protein
VGMKMVNRKERKELKESLIGIQPFERGILIDCHTALCLCDLCALCG